MFAAPWQDRHRFALPLTGVPQSRQRWMARGVGTARLDLVRIDPLDAIPGKAQLGAAEETFAAEIPNSPGAEAMLSPLHLTGSGVPQRVSGEPRGT